MKRHSQGHAMKRHLLTLLTLLAGAASAALQAANAPAPSDFAWRATLTLPAGASVARVTLPAEAMLRLQSTDARDVRVFNADGAAVAFAKVAPFADKAAPPQQTRTYSALPLFTAASGAPGTRPGKGSVAVRLDLGGKQSSVWVRLSDKADPGGSSTATDTSALRLPAVLFDTRVETKTLTALTLQATLPANALVHFEVASSADLTHWTPLAVKGPVFRFDGEGAPHNLTLELAQPLELKGRYLRLGWADQSGVQVQGVSGTPRPDKPEPTRITAPLGAGMADGNTAMVWSLDFATPMSALRLSTTRDNTLVPIALQGRNDTAQPWRTLAHGALYRLGAAPQGSVNPALALHGASVRQLRVQALKGMPLPIPDVHASVEFEPLQLVFLASGNGPFELAAGRADTPQAAVDASLLTQMVQSRLEDLPLAGLANIRTTPSASFAGAALQGILPAGTEPRSVLLWVVLIAGVLVLAGVAYALMRQLKGK